MVATARIWAVRAAVRASRLKVLTSPSLRVMFQPGGNGEGDAVAGVVEGAGGGGGGFGDRGGLRLEQRRDGLGFAWMDLVCARDGGGGEDCDGAAGMVARFIFLS